MMFPLLTDERTLLFMTGEQSVAKPTDFFVGVSDLFAIFLPGAFITYICLKLSERSGIHPAEFLRFRTANEGYVGFVAIAYLVGHMLDIVGAFFLDRWYDFTYAHRKRSPSLSLGSWLIQTPARLVALLKPKLGGTGATRSNGRTDLDDPLLAEAQRLAAGSITPGDPAYQWCKAWICLKSPTAFHEVERMQASSKFFRGLVSVFFLSALAAVSFARRSQISSSGRCMPVPGAGLIPEILRSSLEVGPSDLQILCRRKIRLNAHSASLHRGSRG
jgi:hypothetical protein